MRSQRPRPRDKFLVSVGNGFRARLDVEAIDAPRMGIVNVAGQRILMLKITSGLRLTFESRRGFPGGLDACEFGACEPEFPSLSSPLIVAG